MTTLVILTVVDVVLLVAGLAVYLWWAGSLLTRIAGNLEECAELVRTIVSNAKVIGPVRDGRGDRHRRDATAGEA